MLVGVVFPFTVRRITVVIFCGWQNKGRNVRKTSRSHRRIRRAFALLIGN